MVAGKVAGDERWRQRVRELDGVGAAASYGANGEAGQVRRSAVSTTRLAP